MIRAACITAAFISIFAFPFPATILLGFIAALFVPPLAFFIGALIDLAYYTHEGSALPLYTAIGAVGSVMALFVRRFVKARII